MNARTLCLSILFEKEASGYEIRQLCTNGECAYFVEVSFGSIYPALTKMENEGLLTSHTQEQQGRPAKKIYKITDEGKKEFRNSLFETLNDDVFRSEFLLFARFAHLLPSLLVKQRLLERQEMLEKEIEDLENLVKGLPQNSSAHSGDFWVINYGLEVRRVEKRYVETHMQQLIELSKTNEQTNKQQ